MHWTTTLYPIISLFLLLSTSLSAQVRLTYPLDRQVIQRDNNNRATVQLAGSYSVSIDRVEARFVSLQGGQTTNWETVQDNPTNGQFSGTLTAQGGWYRIEVRAKNGGQVVGTDQLAHFGIGEVLIIFGHSNAQGTTCNDTEECLSPGGSTDERVVSVPINVDLVQNPAYGQYLRTVDPTYLPKLTFSQWTTYSGAAPFNSNAWLWAKMGEKLVQQLNVPVLFYGAGFGGTNMEHMYLAMNNQPFEHGFCKWELQMPYANVRNVMNLYVPSTGVRGILVIHGENDRYSSQEAIRTHNREVMKQCRTKFGKQNLAWVIAISSYVGERFDNVRNAQMQAVADINNDPSQAKVFQGPDMDPPVGSMHSTPDRPDGIHYSTAGQLKYAQLWVDNLTADNNAFFRNSTPYPAEQQPLASIQCVAASPNQLLLSQPAGFDAYNWNTGNTNQQYQVGTGSYSARLQRSTMSTPASRDAMRFYFPPAIAVTNDQKIPSTPTISASSLIACGNSLTLASSHNGPAIWNTGATTQSISTSSGGSYSVKAKNPVYGCESALSGAVTLSTGTADLSLSSQVSRRLATVGDTVRLTVNVHNNGPCDVAGVQFQNSLPANMSLVSAETGLINSGTLVSGSLPLLANAGSISKSYVVRVNAPGTYVNAVQVTSSPVPDPDSQPNSGTGDGQDDMAQLDFRTLSTGVGSASASLFTSANPNQTPLPAVQSSQPIPEALKADLSLSLQADKRVTRTGQPVTFSLTIRNAGGLAATNVGVRATLPTGMTFVSSASGLSVSQGIVQGTGTVIQSGGTVTITFIASVGPSASIDQLLVVNAEIYQSNQPDPDSTPGNSALKKGEDDEASVEIRVSAIQ
ncbi:DUF11 domain-containing protein [Fibrella aquatica]|uniref:DUF11 domain-containing protein n=1 Tax=Fibrella aquatica TaxID=3242487 RepID=UPI003522EC42